MYQPSTVVRELSQPSSTRLVFLYRQRILFILFVPSLRAAPPVRVKINSHSACCRQRLTQTAVLSVNLTWTRASGAALIDPRSSDTSHRPHERPPSTTRPALFFRYQPPPTRTTPKHHKTRPVPLTHVGLFHNYPPPPFVRFLQKRSQTGKASGIVAFVCLE